jgi:hypothetical protein
MEYRENNFAKTAKIIPYCKEYRKIAGSVTATILWQQLEYWFFLKKGEPFYKSLKEWREELAFSDFELRSAFSKIGIAYNSKKQFDAAEDQFQGKMYASYYNKIEHRVYYVRNQKVVSTHLATLRNSISGDEETQSREMKKLNVELTESTTESTTERIHTKSESDFLSFWTAYPKKKAKGSAHTAFRKAIKKTDVQTLLQAIDAQKVSEQWVKESGRFIPYPATWLNQERWGDEVEQKSEEQVLLECRDQAIAKCGRENDWELTAREEFMKKMKIPYKRPKMRYSEEIGKEVYVGGFDDETAEWWKDPRMTKWRDKYSWLF